MNRNDKNAYYATAFKRKIINFMLYVKFFIFFIISTNYCFAQNSNCNIFVLSPKSKLGQNLIKEFFQNSLEPQTKYVDAFLENYMVNTDNCISTFTINFTNDRPGILFDILEAINPTLEEKYSTIIWQDMIKNENFISFRLSLKSKNKEQTDAILSRIKLIKDSKNTNYNSLMNNKHNLLIEIDLSQSDSILKIIASFLNNNGINSSSFLKPRKSEDLPTLILEVELPSSMQESEFALLLENFLNSYKFNPKIILKKGDLIDNILDSFLTDIITPHIENIQLLNQNSKALINSIKKIRANMKKALKVVAEKHLSQLRNDKKTPYIMHQMDIIEIIIDKFKLFDPEFLSVIATLTGNNDILNLISSILEAIILHDSVEDGDISIEQLCVNFDPFVCEIVGRLTKSKNLTTNEQESGFIEQILQKNDAISFIAQIMKLADRLQNLQSLHGTERVFQRRIFFKTFNYFIPKFVQQLSLNSYKNPTVNSLLNSAITIFKQQVEKTGKDFGFITNDNEINQKERIQYEKEERIIDIMQQKGKLNYAEYMQEVLYEKGGFYREDISIGRNKSFDTFAENPFFAHAIAKQLIEIWEKMDKPIKFQIIEMGAGSGTLASNIISAIKQYNNDMYKALLYKIIEISPKLIQDQKNAIINTLGSLNDIPIEWIEGSAENEILKLSNVEGVFLSNELVDQFPVHRIKFENGVAKEIYVKFKNGRFQEELGELSGKEVKEYIKNLPVILPDGVEIPVNIIMEKWQKSISKVLKRGYVLTIDYGGKLQHIARAHPHGVWNRDTNDMNQIYAMTANCDITSEVNFYRLAEVGQESGLNISGYMLQRDFLFNNGIDEIEINGKYLSNKLEWDISSNTHYKVLLQSKGIETSKKLKGFKKSNDSQFEFNTYNLYLQLPVNINENDFILITDKNKNIPIDLFQKGAKELDKYLREYKRMNYSFFSFDEIITKHETYADQNGNFVVKIDLSKLEEMKIFDNNGKVIFDFSLYFKQNSDILEQMNLTEKSFKKEYIRSFNIVDPKDSEIPKYLVLTSHGNLHEEKNFLEPRLISKYNINDWSYSGVSIAS